VTALTDQMKAGLDAPICLTWELTYACNLRASTACRAPRGAATPESSTTEEARPSSTSWPAAGLLRQHRRRRAHGPHRLLRAVEYATRKGVGVKFSTNGSMITPRTPARLAAMDYVDIQISIDGADAATNDPVRGRARTTPGGGPWTTCRCRLRPFKISVVMTRHNIAQLDAFEALADHYGAELRLTRLRPAGAGHPTPGTSCTRSPSSNESSTSGSSNGPTCSPATPSSTCRPRRVTSRAQPVRRRSGGVPDRPRRRRLRLPVRPPRRVQSRLGARRPVGSPTCGAADLFLELREPQSAGRAPRADSSTPVSGGCMAAKFFTGLPLDGPDPECVQGHGLPALAAVSPGARPAPSQDHSKPVPVALGTTRR
jgi:mycofactocin biosynthetic radical S-adenosylmethionine protein MftC